MCDPRFGESRTLIKLADAPHNGGHVWWAAIMNKIRDWLSAGLPDQTHDVTTDWRLEKFWNWTRKTKAYVGFWRRVGVGLMDSLVLATVALMALSLTSARAEIRVITEEFPPYDFMGESGKVEGLSTDVVRAVLEDLGIDVKIEIFPWARAYKMVTQNPDTMLFSVVRTEEREPFFHWVGVVCDVRSYLFKLKSRDDITSEKLSDLKKYSIGVVRGWAGQKYLEKNGFKRLQKVARSDLNIKKLVKGRVDLIEDYDANLIFRMKKLDLDPNLVEQIHFNSEISGQLHAVSSKSTPDHVVKNFNDAVLSGHQVGRDTASQDKWLKLD